MVLPIPTNRTAFLAGAWSGFVLLVVAAIDREGGDFDVSKHNMLFAGIALLALGPAIPFVFGLENVIPKFSLVTWNEQMRNFLTIVKRMFIWLFGAAATMLPGGLLVGLLTGAA